VGDYLEVWARGEARLVPLTGERVTVGRAAGNVLHLRDDEVSAVHAILEPLAGIWTVHDLSSRNGTCVNGQRITGERPLKRGDEIRIGRCRLVFRAESTPQSLEATAVPEGVPEVTRREQDVLVALFGGHLPGDIFLEPASTRTIAQSLHVTDTAIKQHLLHLYDKFDLTEGDRNRARLANEALRRGVVTLAALRAAQHTTDLRHFK
jgi:predicted component of type VI protein secretion system